MCPYIPNPSDKNKFNGIILMQKKMILKIIGELGFVEIYKNGKIQVTPPTMNVHHARMEPFVQFLLDYKRHHHDFQFRGYFTLYDAWREHAEPSESPEFRLCTPKQLQQYASTGTIGEQGRFIQPFHLKDLFPVFKYHVLAFGRHNNDPFTIPIPDTDFIASSGYEALRKEVDDSDSSWEKKISQLYWRGAPHGFPYRTYDPENRRSQRKLLLEWSSQAPVLSDVSFSCSTPKNEQLGYKYLIDIDGEVNAWSGLFWKLYSSSVVFKVESHYEQWYYKKLLPWVHYIPVKGDLTDLQARFEWALQNDDVCCSIAQNGKEFASRLTYDHTVSSFMIEDEMDDLLKHYEPSLTGRHQRFC